MLSENEIKEKESKLGSFNLRERIAALRELKALADSGSIKIEKPIPVVNMHAHTFFSFNAMGYSPSGFVWQAYKRGLEIAGTIDFDVIDALDETLQAGDILGMKTTSGLESRVFIKEHADLEYNSPGEPGVYYLCGHGFFRHPEKGTRAGDILEDMKSRAADRNRYMLDKINDYLEIINLDYEKEILTLTPAGNATERHILQAIDASVREKFKNDKQGLIRFWEEKLGKEEDIAGKIDNAADFVLLMRAKLMKSGGVAYRQPDSDTFPPLDDACYMIRACGAIPASAWVNGKSDGEADVRGHIEFLASKGIEMVNIIPDRDWNIKKDKEYILKKTAECVKVADEMELPVIAGTEMNKDGQKFVDDFDARELAPFIDSFLRGGRILYGHTLLARALDFGYISEGAMSYFGDDRRAKNAFFEGVGKAPIGPAEALERLKKAEPDVESIKKALEI